MRKTLLTSFVILLILSIPQTAVAVDWMMWIGGLAWAQAMITLFTYVTNWAAYTVDLVIAPTAVFTQINPCVWADAGTCPPPYPVTARCCPTYEINVRAYNVEFDMPMDRNIARINGALISMLNFFYMVAILLIGIYIIFMSGSPTGRTMAKDTFIRLVFGMLVVALSPIIFQFMLDLVRGVTGTIMEDASKNYNRSSNLRSHFSTSKYCCTFFVFVFIVSIAGMIAAFRYFLVFVMACFFPLIMFLYFTDVPNPLFSFRGLGTRLFRFTILIFMVQILQVLFLATGLLLSDTPGSPRMVDFLLMIGAYMGILFTPMIGMQLMQWVGAVVHMSAARPSTALSRFVASYMRTGRLSTALTISSGQYMVSTNMGDHSGGENKSPAKTGFEGANPSRGMFSEGDLPQVAHSHQGDIGPAPMGRGSYAATGESPGGGPRRGLNMANSAGLNGDSSDPWNVANTQSGGGMTRSSASKNLGGTVTGRMPNQKNMGGLTSNVSHSGGQSHTHQDTFTPTTISKGGGRAHETTSSDSSGGGGQNVEVKEAGGITPQVSKSNTVETTGRGGVIAEGGSSSISGGGSAASSGGSGGPAAGGAASAAPGGAAGGGVGVSTKQSGSTSPGSKDGGGGDVQMSQAGATTGGGKEGGGSAGASGGGSTGASAGASGGGSEGAANAPGTPSGVGGIGNAQARAEGGEQGQKDAAEQGQAQSQSQDQAQKPKSGASGGTPGGMTQAQSQSASNTTTPSGGVAGVGNAKQTADGASPFAERKTQAGKLAERTDALAPHIAALAASGKTSGQIANIMNDQFNTGGRPVTKNEVENIIGSNAERMQEIAANPENPGIYMSPLGMDRRRTSTEVETRNERLRTLVKRHQQKAQKAAATAQKAKDTEEDKRIAHGAAKFAKDWDKLHDDANKKADREAVKFAMKEDQKAVLFANSLEAGIAKQVLADQTLSKKLDIKTLSEAEKLTKDLGAENISAMAAEAKDSDQLAEYMRDEKDMSGLRSSPKFHQKQGAQEIDSQIGRLANDEKLLSKPYQARHDILDSARHQKGANANESMDNFFKAGRHESIINQSLKQSQTPGELPDMNKNIKEQAEKARMLTLDRRTESMIDDELEQGTSHQLLEQRLQDKGLDEAKASQAVNLYNRQHWWNEHDHSADQPKDRGSNEPPPQPPTSGGTQPMQKTSSSGGGQQPETKERTTGGSQQGDKDSGDGEDSSTPDN